jgi:hypothetical protein
MKKIMIGIVLAMLVRKTSAQETTTCYSHDANTTICEFADGGVTVTYFDAETNHYSKTSYTAQEWKDSLYHKSLLYPPKAEIKSPATGVQESKRDSYVSVPAYVGPKTKTECKAAGYKWHKGACNGAKMPK